MGFPVGYSGVPRMVLHLLFLLGHLRRLSTWLLRIAGADAADGDHYHHHQCLSYYGGDDDATSAALRELEEHSPAVRFDALPEAGGRRPDGCAVCLGDFHGAAEVRRARRCRHVFHRACLDRWAEHGHRTCPLCRTPLLPPSPPAAASPARLHLRAAPERID